MRAVSVTVTGMKIRIVLLPNQQVRHSAAKIAKQVAIFGNAAFVVDNKALLPHVTLCRFTCKKSNLQKVITAVRTALWGQKSFPVTLKGLRAAKDNGVCWSLRSSRQLSTLRQKVFRSVEPYILDAEYKKLKAPYKPHVTLALFKTSTEAVLASKALRVQSRLFTATIIAVTPSVSYGQVPSIIERISLR